MAKGASYGHQNTKSPLVAISIGSAVHLVLDWLLIVWFKLGISGAAYAVAISQYLASLMLLRSLVTVAGAMAAAQLAYAAVATGSMQLTSTAAMALQNARQVQSIMLTHHDVEQHALVGLVHDGDGATVCAP